MISTKVRENIFKKESIYITSHAKKRLCERITEDEYKHFSLVRDAFIKGKQLKSYYKTKSRYLYNGFIYVFSWNRLISVYGEKEKCK
jgi:hypothetical protein